MKIIPNFTLPAALLSLFLGLTTVCQHAERSIEAVKAEISAGIPPADTSREALVARGAYLVTTMLCDDGHYETGAPGLRITKNPAVRRTATALITG